MWFIADACVIKTNTLIASSVALGKSYEICKWKIKPWITVELIIIRISWIHLCQEINVKRLPYMACNCKKNIWKHWPFYSSPNIFSELSGIANHSICVGIPSLIPWKPLLPVYTLCSSTGTPSRNISIAVLYSSLTFFQCIQSTTITGSNNICYRSSKTNLVLMQFALCQLVWSSIPVWSLCSKGLVPI